MPPSNRNIRARLSRGWKFGRAPSTRATPRVLRSPVLLDFSCNRHGYIFFQTTPIESAILSLSFSLFLLPFSRSLRRFFTHLHTVHASNAFLFIYAASSVNFARNNY